MEKEKTDAYINHRAPPPIETVGLEYGGVRAQVQLAWGCSSVQVGQKYG